MQQTQDLNAILARLEALEAENKALRLKAQGGSIKVSQKGAVSVYGLGRYPITLYASQWESLFERQDAIKAFIVANIATLAKKED